MRHFKTTAGEVHALRFGPDGGDLYFLSQEPHRSHRAAPVLFSSGLNDLIEMPDDRLRYDESSLFQHAYRIDARSAKVTGNWSFSGSEVAVFTPDFRSVYYSVSVVVAGGELDLRRLDLATRATCPVYDANVPYPSRVAFTPNGHILAIAGWHYSGDGRHCVHRLDVWHHAELDPVPFAASCLAYSPNGRTLATGNRSDGVRVWRGKVLEEQWSEPASELAWSPEGRLAWGMKGQVTVVRPGSGEPPRMWESAGEALTSLAFSADGTGLLTGTFCGLCTLHDVIAGQQRAAFNWNIGPIHSVAFSPDGLTCAAGGEDGRIVIWDVDS